MDNLEARRTIFAALSITLWYYYQGSIGAVGKDEEEIETIGTDLKGLIILMFNQDNYFVIGCKKTRF